MKAKGAKGYDTKRKILVAVARWPEERGLDLGSAPTQTVVQQQSKENMKLDLQGDATKERLACKAGRDELG